MVSPVQVNSTPTVVTPPGASVGTPREATPVEDKVGESVEKMSSDTLKKSSLNPNAKEFVLNPNARVFVPVSLLIHLQILRRFKTYFVMLSHRPPLGLIRHRLNKVDKC